MESESEGALLGPDAIRGSWSSEARGLCPCVCASDCLAVPGCSGRAGCVPDGEGLGEEEEGAQEEEDVVCSEGEEKEGAAALAA